MQKRLLLFIASVPISGFFLWLALRDIDMTAVGQALAQTDIVWIIIMLVGVFFGLLTRAVRWRGLLGFKMPLLRTFHILNIGMMLNLLPLRAGEIARSILVTREGIPFVTAATSIVVERVIDTLLVVVTLSITLSRLPTAPEWVTRTALLFGAAAVVAFIGLLLFARFPNLAHRIIDWVEARLPLLKRLSLGKLLGHMIDGLEPLTHAGRFAHTIGWTLISWTFSWFTYYAVERALHIETGDLLVGAVLAMTLASLSIAVPATLAGIGPFQLAVRAASDMAGFSTDVGVSFGLLSHGAAVLGYAVLGSIGLLALGVSLSSLLGEKSPSEAQPSEAL